MEVKDVNIFLYHDINVVSKDDASYHVDGVMCTSTQHKYNLTQASKYCIETPEVPSNCPKLKAMKHADSNVSAKEEVSCLAIRYKWTIPTWKAPIIPFWEFKDNDRLDNCSEPVEDQYSKQNTPSCTMEDKSVELHKLKNVHKSRASNHEGISPFERLEEVVPTLSPDKHLILNSVYSFLFYTNWCRTYHNCTN